MARGKIDKDLYGTGLLGESLAPAKGGALAEKFAVPPFTVLNAREGWWQDRKRQWLSLGIKSELGRGENVTWGTGNDLDGFRHGKDMQIVGSNADEVVGIESTQVLSDGKTEARGDRITGVEATTVPTSTEPQTESGLSGFDTRSASSVPTTASIFDEPPPDFDLRGGKFVEKSVIDIANEQGVTLAPALLAKIKAADRKRAQAADLEDAASPPAAKAPYVDPFMALHADACAGGRRLEFDGDSWDWKAKSATGMDVECYRNFFLVCFKRFSDGKRISFELSDRTELDKDALRDMVLGNRIITYNGATYDVPMVFLALKGLDTARLKAASDRIIKGGMKYWDVEREFGLQVPKLDHIDLMEATPSMRAGLKLLGGRLHCPYMVDLPYPEDGELDGEQMNYTTMYCFNDIDNTELLFNAMKEPLELRRQLSNLYKEDVRSRSDAQIGETIVKKRVQQLTGRQINKIKDIATLTNKYFEYKVPDWVSFEHGSLNVMLEALRKAKFYINNSGKVETPPELEGLQVRVGQSTYSMGIGGLHSTEANRAVVADEENCLIDMDVASQYPSIIMKLGLYPPGVGKIFLDVYGKLKDERLAAKAAGDKVKSEGGKIALNGVYGKLGNIYSPLFAPNLMIAVTLTGQLSLLMLIDRFEAAGIPVVSGNTDGVVAFCPRKKEDELKKIVAGWEAATGFQVESARYKAIYNSSVNTYMAVKEDGKVKRKGAIADPWTDGDQRGQLSKNPQMTVCSHAVMQYATKGVPIEETIRACKDPRMFVTVIKVNGGATWRGGYLGRVVRYYWSTDNDPITYVNGGKKVPKTDGAKPLMYMGKELPADVDYARYVDEAMSIANDICIGTFGKLA